eukprot:TRINITY_DN11103_c0_g1_i1.p1 TRINITY_DN11103_c0_g1~~TRINITY_DN11103_c0_g1_i1.p1  ORF type:complete len:945 (+),score=366.56 TRINITY_DN11103_c0_g1_i1:200-3034(+)
MEPRSLELQLASAQAALDAARAEKAGISIEAEQLRAHNFELAHRVTTLERLQKEGIDLKVASEKEKIALRAERDKLISSKRIIEGDHNGLKEERAKHLAQIGVFQTELDRMYKRFRAAEDAVKLRDDRLRLMELSILEVNVQRKLFLDKLQSGFKYLNDMLMCATDEERDQFFTTAPPTFFLAGASDAAATAKGALTSAVPDALAASILELADAAARAPEHNTPQKGFDPSSPPHQSPWAASMIASMAASLRAVRTPGTETAAAMLAHLISPHVGVPTKRDVACGTDDSPPFGSPVRLSGAKFEERLLRAVESFHKEDTIDSAAAPSDARTDADPDPEHDVVSAEPVSAAPLFPPGSESPSRRKRPEMAAVRQRQSTADLDLRTFDPRDAEADSAKLTALLASMKPFDVLSYRLYSPAIDCRGDFATVYLAKRDGESRVAVAKQCKPHHLGEDGHGPKLFQQEAELLQLLRTPPGVESYVVELLDYFQVHGTPYLVLERADGCLSSMSLQPLPTTTRSKLFRKICGECMRLLAQLRGANVVHGDLRPDNVLWKHFSLNQTIIKACDFGHSFLLGSELHEAYLHDIADGEIVELQKIGYQSPELVFGLPFDFQIDTWSMGVTLLELHCGTRMFDSSTPEAYVRSMIDQLGPIPVDVFSRGSFFAEFSSIVAEKRPAPTVSYLDEVRRDDALLADLLTGLLAYDPAKRFTPQRALDHPYCAMMTREIAVPTVLSVGASPPSQRATPKLRRSATDSPSTGGGGSKKRRVTPVSVQASADSPFRSDDSPDDANALNELKDHVIWLLETYGVVSLPFVVSSYAAKYPDVPVSDFEVLSVLEGGCHRIRDVFAAREIEDSPLVLQARPVVLDFLATFRGPSFSRADVERAVAAAGHQLSAASYQKLMNELCKVVSPGSKTWVLKFGDGSEPIKTNTTNSPKTTTKRDRAS